MAFRILRDPEDAKDATQQALIEAWRDLSSLRDPDRWDAWTYRLVVRGCYRASRRRRRLTTVPILPIDEPTTADTAGAIVDRDALERAVQTLPIDQRAVGVLHHHVGLTLVEVARLLGIPDGTARRPLHTATRRLRAAIEPETTTVTTPEGRTA